ncbi:hypothetical protein AML91_02025 [Paenibacillus jilunlii]|uniref:Uncharacterized protein n=1 Tax=Paenibacillus jilunlii TaxID=682956 RepID=A0ABR5T3Y6_9BACL|nr:hypothetical protein AML91_02025 [Paenibacillus jilunlii]
MLFLRKIQVCLEGLWKDKGGGSYKSARQIELEKLRIKGKVADASSVTGLQPLKAVPIKKFLRQQRLEVQTFPAVTTIPHNVKLMSSLYSVCEGAGEQC